MLNTLCFLNMGHLCKIVSFGTGLHNPKIIQVVSAISYMISLGKHIISYSLILNDKKFF